MDLIVIHGYSSSARSVKKSLGSALQKANGRRGSRAIPDLKLHYADYLSLDDQVQLEDVAESLYLELVSKGFLDEKTKNKRTLNFIVHSTGGLVVRQLLKQYDWMGLKDRVRSIVFLAPANFGSPLAHKGRSQLGRVKAVVEKLMGSGTYVSEWQFGEVGSEILKDLELCSPRQWDISNFDLLHPKYGSLYGVDGINAWVFTGANSDTPARLIADTEGTDGVIMTSGAGLSIRRLNLDLVHPMPEQRETEAGWSYGLKKKRLPAVPQMILDELDHGDILEDKDVMDLVLEAFKVGSQADHDKLVDAMRQVEERRNPAASHRYQQFVFKVTDDRDNPVNDYDVTFRAWSNEALRARGVTPSRYEPLFQDGSLDAEHDRMLYADLSEKLDTSLRDLAHRHSTGKNMRRFLVNATEILNTMDKDVVLTFSLMASSGDDRIHYATRNVDNIVVHPAPAGEPSLFYPDTTTQVAIKIDRYGDKGKIVNLQVAK